MVKNLKYLRSQRNISQQQLASVLGVSQQSINRYENHDVEPDISVLIAMADYFHTTVDYLIGRESASAESTAISAREQMLLSNIRRLTNDEQQFLETILRSYLSQKT